MPPARIASYCAIGDSFSEGMGDERADGTPRGWADLVAAGIAHAQGEPILYANFAIRGRLLAPILDDQLPRALELQPALLTLNGGGNDIMRPRVSVAMIAQRIVDTAVRVREAGIQPVIVSGGDPTAHLPLGRALQRRGDELADRVRAGLESEGVLFVDNWSDARLRPLENWSIDKLHLNARGHALAAANVLAALGIAVAAPPGAPDAPGVDAHSPLAASHSTGDGSAFDDLARPRTAEYWRSYVLPWIGRRLTGRSSGDHREPKLPSLTAFGPDDV